MQPEQLFKRSEGRRLAAACYNIGLKNTKPLLHFSSQSTNYYYYYYYYLFFFFFFFFQDMVFNHTCILYAL